MSRWKISPLGLFVLGFGVFVILLLVVLPDVDPLDTAFHRGTAPVVVHSQATSAPAALSLAVPFSFSRNSRLPRHFDEGRIFAVSSASDFLSIFHPSLRC
jgi:hypothetical protein